MSLGFRVCQRQKSVSNSVIERFQDIPVANISDVMSRVIGVGILPFHTNGRMLIGAAVTVRTRPGDNLMVHKALDMGKPGDVIVVDAGGELTSAIMGDLMVNYAIHQGIAGIVVYGAIRDAADISELGLPVHALGVSHRGPYKDGPGEINVPISIGGLVVEPGDLIVGDDDGVVAVPSAHAEEVLELALKKKSSEEQQLEDIRAGKSDRTWVDRALIAANCTWE